MTEPLFPSEFSARNIRMNSNSGTPPMKQVDYGSSGNVMKNPYTICPSPPHSDSSYQVNCNPSITEGRTQYFACGEFPTYQRSPEQQITSPPSVFRDSKVLSAVASPDADISVIGQSQTKGSAASVERTLTSDNFVTSTMNSIHLPPANPPSGVPPTFSAIPQTGGLSVNGEINSITSVPAHRTESSSFGSVAPFGWHPSGSSTDPTRSVEQISAPISARPLPTAIPECLSKPPGNHLLTTTVPPQCSGPVVPTVATMAYPSANSFATPELASYTTQTTSVPDHSYVSHSGPSPVNYAPQVPVNYKAPAPLHNPTAAHNSSSTPPFPPSFAPSTTSSFNGLLNPPRFPPTVTSDAIDRNPRSQAPSYPPIGQYPRVPVPPSGLQPGPGSNMPSIPVQSVSNSPFYRDSTNTVTTSQFPPRYNTTEPPFPRHPGPNHSTAVFRSPGTLSTHSEWKTIKTPIGLLQEPQLLSSDSADLPPQPAISASVNCDSDILRCTLTNFPATSKLLTRTRLPLGLILHPFRDLSSLHTINSTVIVRCRSCRTYINPFVQFIDSGRRWRCPVCFLSNAVPDDFYYDPGTQTYGDPARRPEIRSATVEFIAPPEYMLRPPQPATYLFCFDVSRNAIATGYFRFVCERLAASLNRIPGDSRRQIAFLTFDSAVHFYKLCGDTMRLMICPDLEDPFLPDYEGLVNRIEDSAEPIQDFLLRLPDTFANTNDVGNCLGSALQIALKLVGGTGGRVTVFNTCLPNSGAGSLQLREEQSDRISADVKILGPAVDFYKTFSLDCAAQQVAIDMFIMNSQYCDIATLSGAARFSSGHIYHYPDFYCPPSAYQTSSSARIEVSLGATADQNTQSTAPPVELERFRRDFDRYLSRKIGFEAVMRIRCTQGLSIQAFHGSFFVRSTDLMSLPNVNPDAGFAVQLGISESVDKYSTVCCQAAILYTSAKGDRRIRVHTLCLPVVHNPAEIFQGADQGAIACLIGKIAVDRAINNSVSNAREAVANAVADALSAFASSIGLTTETSISSYAIACPPNLRLLALYLCGLLRHQAFKVGVPVRVDDRSAALERLKSAPPDDMLTLLYPRLYAVHQFISKPLASSNLSLAQKAAALCLSDYGDAQVDVDQHSEDGEISSSSDASDSANEAEQLPGQLHLSARSVSRTGIYLLDTGDMLFLLVGSGDDSAVASDALRQLLNISSPNELPISGGPFNLPQLTPSPEKANGKVSTDIPIARRRLSALINLIRRRRPTNNALICMRHDAPPALRTRFLSSLVEDRTEFAPSYQEFLQMIQTAMKA